MLDQDQFCCSICLDLLKDPVALACGHSYCSSCIEGYWDQDEQKGVYSCPQCRQSFTLRPALKRNYMLAEVVEKLKEGANLKSTEWKLSWKQSLDPFPHSTSLGKCPSLSFLL